MMRYVAFSQFN